MKRSTYLRLRKKASVYVDIIDKKILRDGDCVEDLDKTCENINKYRGVLNKYLNFLIYEDVALNRRIFKKYGLPLLPIDTRTGHETYGYESIEKIERNLSYISDRFRVIFRIRWLMGVPEEVKLIKFMEQHASPSYGKSKKCCNCDCWLLGQGKGICWGDVGVDTEVTVAEDDWVWIHACQGHKGMYDDPDEKYKEETQNQNNLNEHRDSE